MFRGSDLEKIIDHFTIRGAQIMAISELSALQIELCRNLNHQYDDKALEEKLADAQIALNELMLIHDVSKSDIEYHMNMKIKRQIDIIKTLEDKKDD